METVSWFWTFKVVRT